MTNPTLNSVALGKVESINSIKSANIVPINLAGTDSDGTFVMDLFGVTRIITINGVYTGSTTSAVKSQVDAIDALIDGQQSVVAFVSDETGTINCMINSHDVTWENPSNRARYTIQLVEGSSA
jgi:hypothetical protein